MKEYSIQCKTCGSIFKPTQKSSLWWRAKNHDEQFFIDCKTISGHEHGCLTKHPKNPFIVFGYDVDCCDFEYGFNTMVEAIKFYKELKKDVFNLVYINGLSKKVQNRVEG